MAGGEVNEKEFARLLGKIVIVPSGRWAGCYEGVGGKPDKRGYMRFWFRGQWRQGHRICYTYMNDDLTPREEPLEIPKDKNTLDHECTNRACWRPGHLVPCTLKKNHELRAMRYWERKRLETLEEVI